MLVHSIKLVLALATLLSFSQNASAGVDVAVFCENSAVYDLGNSTGNFSLKFADEDGNRVDLGRDSAALDLVKRIDRIDSDRVNFSFIDLQGRHPNVNLTDRDGVETVSQIKGLSLFNRGVDSQKRKLFVDLLITVASGSGPTQEFKAVGCSLSLGRISELNDESWAKAFANVIQVGNHEVGVSCPNSTEITDLKPGVGGFWLQFVDDKGNRVGFESNRSRLVNKYAVVSHEKVEIFLKDSDYLWPMVVVWDADGIQSHSQIESLQLINRGINVENKSQKVDLILKIGKENSSSFATYEAIGCELTGKRVDTSEPDNWLKTFRFEP